MKTHRTLRDFIRVLRDEGDLISLKEPYDPKYEIATVLSEIGKRKAPALHFETVKGFGISVIGNLFGTVKRLSLALGIEESRLLEDVIPRLEKRVPPVPCSEDGSWEESGAGGEIDLLKVLPALTHYSKDSGPYITSGISSARDPRTGVTGRGLHRMELRGKDPLRRRFPSPEATCWTPHRRIGGVEQYRKQYG